MIRHPGSVVVRSAVTRLAMRLRRPACGRDAAIWRVGLCIVAAIGIASCHDGPTSGLGGEHGFKCMADQFA